MSWPETTRAVKASGSGSERTFSVDTVALPSTLPADDILIKVLASAVPFSADIDAAASPLRLASPRPWGVDLVGVVIGVGEFVSNVSVGDHVAAILPLDDAFGALADHCVISSSLAVPLPAGLDARAAASALGPGFEALWSLGKLSRVSAGDSVLIVDAATPAGLMTIQLALHLRLQVVAGVASAEQQAALQAALGDRAAAVSVLILSPATFVAAVAEATAGDLFDAVIEAQGEHDVAGKRCELLPFHMAAALGPGAQWVSRRKALQLDPPVSRALFCKGAAVAFLNAQANFLAPNRLGVALRMNFWNCFQAINNFCRLCVKGARDGGRGTRVGAAVAGRHARAGRRRHSVGRVHAHHCTTRHVTTLNSIILFVLFSLKETLYTSNKQTNHYIKNLQTA